MKRFQQVLTFLSAALLFALSGPAAASFIGDDQEKIRAGLENLKGHLGAAGIYTTSPADHDGLHVDSMRMLVVEKAAFKLAPK